MQHDIFISYRRSGGEYTAKILRDRLTDAGYRVFFDVESLRSGDFNTKLYSVIDECTDFLLVLSPDSLERCINEGDWVRREVEYALTKGKNVIPVMLRGFTFPEVLPPSLEPLRFQNGLEANSQFFDAFLEQLQGRFLHTKPPLWRRLTQNTVFRRMLPALLALVLLAGIGTGIYLLAGSRSSLYPRTKAQKNLTGEVLYYTMSNLSAMDQIGKASASAIDAVERYLAGGSDDYSSLCDSLALCHNTLDQLDLDAAAMGEQLHNALSDSPFDLADLSAMHDETLRFRQEWDGYLDYLELVAGPGFYMDTQDKLQIVQCHRTALEETLSCYALCANDMLLPVTAEAAMEEFWFTYLPGLTAVPLSAAGWQEDAAVLESAVAQSLNRQENAVLELTALVGSTNMENLEMEQTLTDFWLDRGLTQAEARKIIESDPQLTQDLVAYWRSQLPVQGDTAEVLWSKLMNLIGIGFYPDARECAAVFAATAEADTDTAGYMPAVYAYIDLCRQGDVQSGVMVTGFEEPHEVFQYGDIITHFDAEACHSYEQYASLKQAVAEPGDYTLDILRYDPQTDSFTPMQLALSTKMPGVYLSTLASSQD